MGEVRKVDLALAAVRVVAVVVSAAPAVAAVVAAGALVVAQVLVLAAMVVAEWGAEASEVVVAVVELAWALAAVVLVGKGPGQMRHSWQRNK